jgi:hypothetical protein
VTREKLRKNYLSNRDSEKRSSKQFLPKEHLALVNKAEDILLDQFHMRMFD